MPKYAAALDQGTTSSRAMIFDHSGHVVSVAQKEHEQIYPKPGWVEHDAKEIWARSQEVLDEALEKASASADDIAGLGITNQRETALVWDRNTGEPVHNALVWQDTRTDKLVDELSADGGQDRFRDTVGLPLATYFSGPKVRWILDNVEGAREKAEAGDLIFGNMDTWLIWNLTGGTNGGLHITDVTNASRTMLMDLKTLSWDTEIASTIGVPMSMLPEIHASSEVYGDVKTGAMSGVALAGDLGDQQAATFGQACFDVGQAKNTYGTGNFMLINTGTELVHSKSGLLTTVGYKIGDNDAIYCLEGSIAITGALVAAPFYPEKEDRDDAYDLTKLAARVRAYAQTWKGKLHGRFVLLDPPRDMAVPHDVDPARYDDKKLGELVLGQHRIRGRVDAARRRHSVKRDRVLGQVRGAVGEHIALAEAPLGQARGQPAHRFDQLWVGDRPTGRPVDDRRLVAALAGALEHELGERHVRNLDVRKRAADHSRASP